MKEEGESERKSTELFSFVKKLNYILKLKQFTKLWVPDSATKTMKIVFHKR